MVAPGSSGVHRPLVSPRPTYGYARPRYEQGRLVLRVGFDDPGLVVPWKVRYTPPCCGGAHD